MNIKQASEQSGVSAPNIRFYEKEGLLTPARRQGNDYRDYTAGDIRALKLIRMLRMLEFRCLPSGPYCRGSSRCSRHCKTSRPCWSSRPRIWRQPEAFAQNLSGSGRRQKRWMWTPV